MTVTSQGFDEARVKRISQSIQSEIDQEKYDGLALLVTRRGEVAIRSAWGFADRAEGRDLNADDPIFTMSTGKQFTAAVVLSRIERGDLSFWTRVAEVIPEFGNQGKERITLAHLLNQTSGVARLFPPLAPEDFGDLDRFVAAVCGCAVESPPGERVHYSALAAHAVMAEMVRRTEGGTRSFRDIIQEELFDPLGMKNTSLGIRPDLGERMCPVVVRYTEPDLLDPQPVESLPAFVGAHGELPGGGFVSTVDDMTRFCEMLRRGGELDGHRILSPAMIEFVTRNHTGSMRNELFDCILDKKRWGPWPAYIGLGFFVRGDAIIPGPFGNLNSSRAFGGLGAGSTFFWVDPEHHMTFVLLATGVIKDTDHIQRCQRISDMVLAALVE